MRLWPLFLLLTFAGYFSGCSEGTAYFQADTRFFSLGPGNSLNKAKSFSLKETNQHDIIFVNFFAPDCPPCEKEIPELEKFIEDVLPKNKKATFVAIGSALEALAGGDGMSDEQVLPEVVRFQKKYKTDLEPYIAGTEKLRAYGVTAFPETYIFYRTGEKFLLQRKFISSVTSKQLEEYITYKEYKSDY